MEKITGKFYNRKLTYLLIQLSFGILLVTLTSIVLISSQYIKRTRKVESGHSTETIGDFSFDAPIYKDAPPLSFEEQMLYYWLPAGLIIVSVLSIVVTATNYYKIIPVQFSISEKTLDIVLYPDIEKQSVQYYVSEFTICQRNALSNSRHPHARNLVELRFDINGSDVVFTEEIEQGKNPGLPMYSGDRYYVENYFSRDFGTLVKVANMVKSKHFLSGGV
jgi:hypothetical protein